MTGTFCMLAGSVNRTTLTLSAAHPLYPQHSP
jgi:hypothetical protein